MPMNEENREVVAAFRTYIEDFVANDDRYGEVTRMDQDDESLLLSRFAAGSDCWFEVAVRPSIPQVRVAFITNDRWKSEEVEQAIQDSGESMNEFVGLGFGDAGLDWEEPPVEHFRVAGEFFYFATPLEVEDLVDLESETLRSKVLRMLDGYLLAFGPAITVEDE